MRNGKKMSKSKTKLTADHLIKDYRDLERKLGRQSTSQEFAKKCHSITSLITVFGKPGWKKLLEAVGAKPYRRFSTRSVQDCYRHLRSRLGRIPSKKEFEERCCSSATLSKLFGGSGWSNLLKSVGNYREHKRKRPSKTSLLSAFNALTRRLGKAPNLAQYKKLSGYSLKDIKHRFGENAWQVFLKNAKDPTRRIPSNLTAEHLIRDFLELQQSLGRRPSISEYSFQCHTPKVLDRVFGKSGWKNMISAVGAKALPKNVIPASHLVDDYIETYRCLGRKPTVSEFMRMQRHSLNVLDRAFGRPGWSSLASEAQEKMKTR
jgi:hypothetical protein